MAIDERIARSRKQEARIAKLGNGTTNMGSGNGWQRKHDVRTPGLLWEMKRTDGKQITLKLADLLSAHKEAWSEDRTPVFHVEIGQHRYIMMEELDAAERMGIDI